MKPRVIALIFLSLLVVGLLYLERAILAPFILAAVFAYILNPVITFLSQRTKVGRAFFIVLFFVLLFTVIGWLGAIITRQIFAEAQALTDEARIFLENAEMQITGLPIWLRDSAHNAVLSIKEALTIESSIVLPFFSGAAARVFATITFLFSLFYFLKDGGRFVENILLLFPGESKLEAEIVLRRINAILGNYLRGQLLIVLIMAILGFTLFTLLGVRFSLILGMVIGLAEIVPMIGPIIAGSIVTIVALVDGTSAFGLHPLYDAGVILAAYVILNQAENYLIVPQIMGKVTQLHPLMIFFSVLAGGHLFGILGFILAVPIVASLRIVFEYLLDKLASK
ncbi:AI-2E family transporter [Candidatus Microgenomates bacterium]|nr:AI-2E family transporter [Candidatus Microgenomates bacterium]